jgi:nucleoside-diphosphate-sugar epimerase
MGGGFIVCFSFARRSARALMSVLICLGYGYCAEHFVAEFGGKFERIVGTVRGGERAAVLNAYKDGPLEAVLFDGAHATPELREAIAQARYALVSIPPGDSIPSGGGDPVLAVLGDDLTAAKNLRSIVYLSTVGVYGDHGGGWVDEQTPLAPVSARSRRRSVAERAWQELGARQGIAVAVLRLAGIYGPGQNALVQIARGKARRIVKPGQFFNRIHVGDIAQAIDAAFAQCKSGVFNVADDEPAPPADPTVFAARLLDRPPPPEEKFDDVAASMSPMALSFWRECRRVKNEKLKRALGVTLRYPTYREGLRALLEKP